MLKVSNGLNVESVNSREYLISSKHLSDKMNFCGLLLENGIDFHSEAGQLFISKDDFDYHFNY
jgi:hypothetical protein